MKNKFLLMAVISALAALVIVPSVSAVTDTNEDAEVSTSVTSGDFVLTGHGAYGTTGVSLNSVSVSSSDQLAVSTLDMASGHYFQLKDYSSTPGGSLLITMPTDFSGGAGGDTIPLENLVWGVNYSGTAYAQPACAIDSVTRGCSIVSSFTSPLALSSTYAAFNGGIEATPYSVSMTDTDYDFFAFTNEAPYVVRVGLERLELTVPGNTAQGSYSSTVYVLAVDNVI